MSLPDSTEYWWGVEDHARRRAMREPPRIAGVTHLGCGGPVCEDYSANVLAPIRRCLKCHKGWPRSKDAANLTGPRMGSDHE